MTSSQQPEPLEVGEEVGVGEGGVVFVGRGPGLGSLVEEGDGVPVEGGVEGARVADGPGSGAVLVGTALVVEVADGGDAVTGSTVAVATPDVGPPDVGGSPAVVHHGSSVGGVENSSPGRVGNTPDDIASSRQLSPEKKVTPPTPARTMAARADSRSTGRRFARGGRAPESKDMTPQTRRIGLGTPPGTGTTTVARMEDATRTTPGRATGFIEVADRVLVARYPEWDVNVGLVLGRDGAVVVDTRGSGTQGRRVLDDVRRLGRDIVVTHVVNTHVHFDHTFGNIAFDDATVHAHDNVGRTIEDHADRIKALFRADPGDAPEAGYTAEDVVDVLATRVRRPDRTFGSHATVDLGDRVVTMAWHGRGHTDGDVAVAVPDTDALFLGDLVEESAHPSFGDDSWPLEWADTLAAHLVETSDRTVVVPGHGRPVDVGFVARQRDEVAAVAAVIRERRSAGVDVEDAVREPDRRLPYPVAGLAEAFRRGYAHLDLLP
jgi:glyoxylase-like metal-dependent hydrolase (beta-lactamase superfamily II)